MKTIYINKQLKEDWTRVFNHIANLFYEDSVIQIENDGADMTLAFEHSVDASFTIHTAAELVVDTKHIQVAIPLAMHRKEQKKSKIFG